MLHIRAIAFLALFLCCATAHSEDFQIKFDRPSQVGDQFRLVASGSNNIKKVISVDGKQVPQIPPESTSYSVHFEGIGTVKQVSSDGQPTEVSYKIDKCTGTFDHAETEIAPKDSVLVAKIVNGKTQYTLKESVLQGTARESLWLVIDLGAGVSDADDIFGTTERKKVGDSWAPNTELASIKFKKEGIDAPASSFTGSVTLVDLKVHNDIPCLQIKSVLNVHGTVPGLGDLPEGVKLKRAIVETEISGLLPQDVTRHMPLESMSMELEAELVATRPDGGTMSIVQSGKRIGKRERMDIKADDASPGAASGRN